MSKRNVVATLGLAGALVLGACGDAVDPTSTTGASDTTLGSDTTLDTGTTDATDTTMSTDTTMDGGTTTDGGSSSDPEAAAAEIQDELIRLAEEIQSSAASDEIQSIWSEFQTEMTAAMAEFQAEGTFDATALREHLQTFEDDLDALGDQVEPELRDAWDSFRDEVEDLVN